MFQFSAKSVENWWRYNNLLVEQFFEDQLVQNMWVLLYNDTKLLLSREPIYESTYKIVKSIIKYVESSV